LESALGMFAGSLIQVPTLGTPAQKIHKILHFVGFVGREAANLLDMCLLLQNWLFMLLALSVFIGLPGPGLVFHQGSIQQLFDYHPVFFRQLFHFLKHAHQIAIFKPRPGSLLGRSLHEDPSMRDDALKSIDNHRSTLIEGRCQLILITIRCRKA
jgi:hypothetical protein